MDGLEQDLSRERAALEVARRRRTEAELKEQGFGVLTGIDVKATMKEKLDVDVPHNVILASPAAVDRKRAIDQRLADGHITPLWYPEGEHEHVEQILELLLD